MAGEFGSGRGLKETGGRADFPPPAERGLNHEESSQLPFGGVPVIAVRDRGLLPSEDRKSTRLNSSHIQKSRMPSSA